MTDLTIPERCLECPVMRRGMAHIDRCEDQVSDMIQSAVSREFDEIAPSIAEEVKPSFPSAIQDRITSEFVAKTFRAVVGRKIEGLNNHIDGIKSQLGGIAATCSHGALNLTGTPDEGVTAYSAVVCTSSSLDSADVENITINRVVTDTETL